MIASVGYLALSGVPLVSDALFYCNEFLSMLIQRIITFSAENFSFLYLDISAEIFGVAVAGVLAFAGCCLIIKATVPIKATALFIAVSLSLAAVFNVCSAQLTAHIYISEYGTVAAYDRESAVIISAEKYDYYTIDAIVEGRNAVFVDSAAYMNDRKIQANSISVYSDFEELTQGGILLSCDNEVLTLEMKDKSIEINSDCVIIDSIEYSRALNEKFKDSVSLTVSFTKNSRPVLRRG